MLVDGEQTASPEPAIIRESTEDAGMDSDRSARAIFFISDGTGITAETIGQSILTQFDGVRFDKRRLPFVDSPERAREAVLQLRAARERSGQRVIVINTVIDPTVNAVLADSGALMLDVFAPFISPLEAELGQPRTPKVGKAHGMADPEGYEARIAATNYALTHDDGVDVDYGEAELILIGVSRAGKTPTCLYLALHFGIRAANYPLVQEDLEALTLPERLRPHRSRIFGLTIDPQRLSQIRSERRANSRYASLAQCRWEVEHAEQLLRSAGIPYLSSTHTSIEEMASKIMQRLGLQRQLY